MSDAAPAKVGGVRPNHRPTREGNADMKANSYRCHWQQIGADIDAKRANRSQVRAYAKQHGIECARQQAPAPKRTKRKVTQDQRPSGCRSLSAAEIAALGYETTKAPEPKAPERPEAKPREARSIEAWQRNRKLSGSWV